MRKILALCALLLAALPAHADMFGSTAPSNPIAATGSPTARLLQTRFAQQMNVKDWGAKGDMLTFTDGTIAAGTNAFSSNLATFTQADVGKTIVVDYAGVAGVPLVSTIASVTDTHHVTLAANASVSVPYVMLYSLITSAIGTGYAPNDTITDGNFVGTVYYTQLVSATINAPGSGGTINTGQTSGSCQLQGTTGAGEAKFIVNATLTAGAVTAIGTTVKVGAYSTNPTSIAAEPVTPVNGCANLTGATLTVTMGAYLVFPTTKGSYVSAPSSPVCVTGCTSSGSGTGATFTFQSVTAGWYAYGTDDTSAISAAFTASNSANLTGTGTCVTFPASAYLISSPLPEWTSNGCVKGEGWDKSYLVASPALSGAVLRWSEAWGGHNGAIQADGGLFNTRSQTSGPILRDMSIIGDRNGTNTQHAVMFVDRNDYVQVDGVFLQGFNGACLATGVLDRISQAYVRESNFSRIKAWYCGNATWPAISIDSTDNAAGGDATNELKFDQIDIFASYGHGFQIKNTGTGSATRFIEITKLRVESKYPVPSAIQGDALVIGDPAAGGQTDTVSCYQCEIVDMYPGRYGVVMDASSTALAPYLFDFNGVIGNNQWGSGIHIVKGRASTFRLWGLSSIGTNVVTESTAGADLQIFGAGGAEQSYTYSIGGGTIDHYPVIFGGLAGVASTAYLSTSRADSGVGGNTPGAGSINLTLNRQNSYNVSSGANSVAVGGINLTAGGTGSVAVGGNNNGVTGQNSAIVGGIHATDRGWYGARCHASGALSSFSGDANFCEQVLRCQLTSTAACRATADNAAASSSTNNTVNIVDKAVYNVTADCAAVDHTTPANNMSWNSWAMFLTRGTGAATTALQTGTKPTPFTNGTVTGADISATADTSLGALNMSFTPPTGNSDTWDFTCHVQAHQAQ